MIEKVALNAETTITNWIIIISEMGITELKEEQAG